MPGLVARLVAWTDVAVITKMTAPLVPPELLGQTETQTDRQDRQTDKTDRQADRQADGCHRMSKYYLSLTDMQWYRRHRPCPGTRGSAGWRIT